MKIVKNTIPPTQPKTEYTITMDEEEASLLGWTVGSVSALHGTQKQRAFFTKLTYELPMLGSDPFNGDILKLPKAK